MLRVTYSRLQRYGIAFFAVALALMLMLLHEPLMTMKGSPFVLGFAAVVVSAWYGGLGPGLVATALAAGAGIYFISPVSILGCTAGDTLQLGWFVFVGVLISVLCGAVHSARRQVELRMLEDQRHQSARLQVLAQQQAACTESEAARAQIINILESITDGFFALDQQWRYTYVNREAARLAQRLPEELLGKNIWSEFPQAVGTRLYQEYHRATKQQVTVEFEEFYPLRNSWVEIRAYPANGGLAVYFRDITEHKRALETLRQQAERERLLGMITQQIRRSLNLDDILDTTVTEVRHVLQADRVVIYRCDPDQDGQVVAESVGMGWPSILGTTVRGSWFNDRMAPYRQGKTRLVDDVQQLELPADMAELVNRQQIQAVLAVPILESEKLLGIISAQQCSGPRPWQPFEIDLLEQLATQVAFAIHQSQLYKQIQHQATREQALNRVTQAIRNSLDLETVFSTAVCEIGKLLQVDRASIAQYLPERQLWLNVADYRQRPDLPVALGLEIPDEGNEFAARLKRLEVVQLHDTNTCADKVNRGLARTFPGAWLLVPLHYRDSLWGSLSLSRHGRQYHWQDLEVELACAIADQLAVAIQQAMLYQQVQNLNADLECQVQKRTVQLHEQMQQLKVRTAELAASQAQMQAIMDHIPAIVYIIGVDGCIKFANAEFYKVFGQRSCNLSGRHRSQFLTPEDAAIYLQDNQSILAAGKAMTFENDMSLPDGVHTYLTVNFPLRDATGEVQAFCGVALDITERKQMETALKKSEQQLRAIVDNAPLGIYTTDGVTCRFANQYLLSLYGVTLEEVLSADAWMWALHPEEREWVVRDVTEARIAGRNFAAEYRSVDRKGNTYWVLDRAIPIRDETGQIQFYQGFLVDITQRRRAEEELRKAHAELEIRVRERTAELAKANQQLQAENTERKRAEEKLLYNAFHDPLTGLPNRALLMDRLGQALEQAKRHKDYLFAVLFLDIDRFKLINDSLGHILGDQFLRVIAGRLEACLRSTDTAARLGGDEFTILLESINDVSDALHLADRIQTTLALPFNLDGQEVFTTASIGIALSPSGYDRPEDLLRDADTAMYRAKALGKARCELFNPDMYALAVTRLQLETDLRRAIALQEFQVYYQPIVALKSGRISGFEALLRWQHPDRGLVVPADFIPLAEETGLIVSIGYWVLRQACRQMQAWLMRFSTNSPFKISVNLSVKQFSQPDLSQQIGQILRETGVSACSLGLEITESAIMENGEAAIAALSQLRELGIELLIDDFGTGYSSLGRLQRFPISVLKLDRSFVNSLGALAGNSAITETIVTLAHKLGVEVTAEGVETKEQLAQLRELNCESGQGYFFSQPLDSEAAEALIVANPQW